MNRGTITYYCIFTFFIKELILVLPTIHLQPMNFYSNLSCLLFCFFVLSHGIDFNKRLCVSSGCVRSWPFKLSQTCKHQLQCVFPCHWRSDLLSSSTFFKLYQFTHELNTIFAHQCIGYLCIHWYVVLVGRRQKSSVHVVQMKAFNSTIIWGHVHVNMDKWDSLNAHSS